MPWFNDNFVPLAALNYTTRGTCSNRFHMFKQLLIMHVLATRQKHRVLWIYKNTKLSCTVSEYWRGLAIYVQETFAVFLIK